MNTKFIKTAFTLLLMVLIFYFSSQPASQSSELSDSICYRMVSIIDKTFSLSLNSNEKLSICEQIETPIRKLAHMTEYAILSISFYLTLQGWNVEPKRFFYLAVLCTSLYAMTDEFHQLFVPGRSGEIRDVLIDTCGGIFGGFLIHQIERLRRKFRAKKL